MTAPGTIRDEGARDMLGIFRPRGGMDKVALPGSYSFRSARRTLRCNTPAVNPLRTLGLSWLPLVISR